MKNLPSRQTMTTLAGACAGVLLTASCSQQPPAAAPAAAAPANEVGRYQVVVTPDGDRGSILFLVDSVGGQSWIYRPPQGTAVNGFWSDIPRLTYSPEHWRSVFSPPATPLSSGVPTGAPPASALTPPQR